MPTERRRFLKTAAGFWAAPGLIGASVVASRAADVPVTPAGAPAHFPAYEPVTAKEMVGVSHGNVERVGELLKLNPGLALAVWDWGYGDWETALGAASHVGNREIARLLMDNGARPDIFTFAMLGQLDVVKAYVAANPGIQRTRGPHGITLMAHARKGGEMAKPVVDYLETLGDADLPYATVPLPEELKAAYVGDYSFGPGPGDLFRVALSKDGALGITRLPDGANRMLFHLGSHEFHPAGNAAARIRFTVDGAAVQGVQVDIGTGSASAARVVG
jgi:hypothetical protein